MTIVTQDDIRRSGADNIPDVLQFITGIDTRRYSFGQVDVAARGYDQALYPRVLVLVNGRQAYLDDDDYVDWNAIPVELSEVRQIEVVKGPASALFGFNASAGVINIITYDPLLDDVNTATARGGTQHYGQGEAAANLHAGKTFGARVSIGGFTARDFSKPDDGLVYPDPRNGRVNVGLRWQVMPWIQLRGEAAITDDRVTQYLPSSYSPGRIRASDIRFGASAHTRISVIDLDAYRNQAHEQYQPAGTVLLGMSVLRVVKLTDLFKASADTVRLGVEYRNNLATGDGIYAGTISYDDYAADVMWSRNLTSKLTMVNAVRLDHTVLHSDATVLPVDGLTQALFNRKTITAPSFNSGFTYAATARDTVRLSAGRGLQMPSLFDFGREPSPGPFEAVGSPRLSPTATWNLDLGYDRRMDTIDSTLTLDGFLQRQTDLLSVIAAGYIVPTADGIAAVEGNIGSSNEAGIEIGIKGKSPQGVRWNASYVFCSIHDDITSAVAPTSTTEFASGTPTSKVVAGLGYSAGPWEMDINGRWQSGYRDWSDQDIGTVPVQIGNYVLFSDRLGFNATKHITLAVSGQQFNLARIQQTSGFAIERRVFGSVTVHC